MRLSTLLTPLALLPTVLSSGQTISDAITAINTVTQTLQSKVSSWKGDLLGTLPIIVSSTELLKDINNATKVTKASDPLEPLEALTVAVAVNTLSGSVNQTISAIVAKKRQFDKLLLSPVILLNLELEKDATDKLGAALGEKVPEELKGAAAQLQATIDGYFEAGIEAYKLF
ncbi:putative antigenic cell wall galactomanno protein [Coniochaeta sp. 2T2.1]|nr:putative antigenic cell wall galactomanno protein [Coniochaeta sp. 2T2.1]